MSTSEKVALRTWMNEKRMSLSQDEVINRSSVIMGKIEVLIEFLRAKTVFIYWSLPEEVQTQELILKWSDVKTFILPQIQGDYLVLRKITTPEEMKKEKIFGIMEPTGEIVTDYSRIDLALIPGVAFDRSGNRLGRGKAFYDKILPHLTETYKVGLAFDFQVLKSIPYDELDVPMDKIITD